MLFENFKLSSEILQNLKELGFENPSPIQEKSIPIALEGKDLIGLAQTGTGKTAAFGLPILSKIEQNRKTQYLVIAPTRELVTQVAKSFDQFTKGMKITTLAVYGGTSIERQITTLKKGVEVIVATPGRLIDLLDRKVIDLSNLKATALDEADEMLNMGFIEDIKKILKLRPEGSQTLLFSATMPKDIADLSKKFLTSPEVIDVVPKNVSKDSISQHFFNVKSEFKVSVIDRILSIEDPKLVIIFTNTKVASSDLAYDLQALGHSAEAIHGDLDQKERERTMHRFRTGRVKILCATDVAARGIDVANVDMVFNFDLPNEKEFYVHRIGRTGRAGRTGKAYSFVCNGKDRSTLRVIEQYAGNPITPANIPSSEDFFQAKMKSYFSETVESFDTKIISALEELNNNGLTTEYIAQVLLSKLLPLKDVNIVEGTKFSATASNGRNSRNPRERDDQSQIILSVGKSQKVNPPMIIDFIKNNSDIFARNIGDIDIFKEETLVQLPSKRIPFAIKSLNNKKLNGFVVKVRIAR
ncbi:MAG: DEAD/DEAH box helicase [Patescibacteria group bacterium]